MNHCPEIHRATSGGTGFVGFDNVNVMNGLLGTASHFPPMAAK